MRSSTTLFILLLSILCPHVAAQQPPRLLHRWEVEPALNASWVPEISKPKILLEPARFSSAKREERLAEARKAIQHANEPNLVGREESLQSLLAKLKQPDDDPQVQLGLASAAIVLSGPEQAAVLWETLSPQLSTRPLIEAALIQWNSPVALDTWRARIAGLLSNEKSSNSDLVVALTGLAKVGAEQDGAQLQTLLRSDRINATMQVFVARTLGALVHHDLEGLAQDVTTAASGQYDLVAASLLAEHTSERSRELLEQILKSNNAAAQQVAYSALAKNFPKAARELAPTMIAHHDTTVRRSALEVLHRYDDGESLKLQTQAIDDPNRTLRNLAREQLLQKASQASLRPIVDEAITNYLKSNSTRAIVQAIQLVVALNENERCAVLVDLLDHPDMDASMTAAWGLQALAPTPELVERVFKHTEVVTERLKNSQVETAAEILRQAYLFEVLGRSRYKPALESLKLYIPKNRHKMGDTARTSAIWAIGKIIEGSKSAAGTEQLSGPMLDQSIDDMEAPSVQYACAIAIGYINAPSKADYLNKITGQPPLPLALARDWALNQK